MTARPDGSLPPLTPAELALAKTGQTYNELCDQLGITDPSILAEADRRDGYKPQDMCIKSFADNLLNLSPKLREKMAEVKP